MLPEQSLFKLRDLCIIKGKQWFTSMEVNIREFAVVSWFCHAKYKKLVDNLKMNKMCG
jgi:hypothetical protein